MRLFCEELEQLMSLLRNITAGLRSLFRKEQLGRELDEELRTYREMAAEEKVKGLLVSDFTDCSLTKPHAARVRSAFAAP